jgi:hypothetical protein
MDRYLPVFLPIIWVVVSTAVGLILYKTSKAFFEHGSQRADGQVRRVRLVGSVVIAGATLLALWKVTPNEALSDLSDPRARIPREFVAELREASRGLDLAMGQLEACAAVTVAGQCEAELSAVSAASDRVMKIAEQLNGEGGANP